MRGRGFSSALASSSLVLSLCSCAADRVTEPAKTIGTAVSAFQAELSTFQDTVKTYQSDEQTIATGNLVQRDQAVTATNQLQIEWALRQAGGPADIFKTLQQQGAAAVAAIVTPATAPSAPVFVTLPLDKLASVAKDMDQIAKPPGTKADLQFLVNYGSAVSQQMGAASKPPAPAAAE
jgi:hypothetical protein